MRDDGQEREKGGGEMSQNEVSLAVFVDDLTRSASRATRKRGKKFYPIGQNAVAR